MKRKPPSKSIRQLDIAWDAPEPFALVIAETTDGDRIAAQNQQRETGRALSDQLQTKFKEAA